MSGHSWYPDFAKQSVQDSAALGSFREHGGNLWVFGKKEVSLLYGYIGCVFRIGMVRNPSQDHTKHRQNQPSLRSTRRAGFYGIKKTEKRTCCRTSRTPRRRCRSTPGTVKDTRRRIFYPLAGVLGVSIAGRLWIHTQRY